MNKICVTLMTKIHSFTGKFTMPLPTAKMVFNDGKIISYFITIQSLAEKLGLVYGHSPRTLPSRPILQLQFMLLILAYRKRDSKQVLN